MPDIDLRPRLGARPFLKGPARFLMICFFDPNGIVTVYEQVRAWQEFSEYSIEVLNLWPGDGSALSLPAGLNLDDYQGVLIHPAVAYNPDNLASLDRRLRRGFTHYDGVKILIKQDEHYRSASYASFMQANG